MQNFGPVHIEKNIEHAAYVDASTNITLAPSQTIVEVSAQNNAMYEYGFFYKMDIDKKADKKDVFAAFAAMIHDPASPSTAPTSIEPKTRTATPKLTPASSTPSATHQKNTSINN